MPTSQQEISPDLGLKLDTLGSKVDLFVRDLHTVQMQSFLTIGSYGGAVITMKRSLDGLEFFAMDPAETLSADGIGNLHDVRGAAVIRAEVTTTGTAGARARVALVGWSE